MKIEEIPSDKLVVMTKFWHKAFNIAGCDPNKEIKQLKDNIIERDKPKGGCFRINGKIIH